MKPTLRIPFRLVLLAALLCTPAVAAPPSAESVERLLVVTKSEDVLAASSANVERVMRQVVSQARGDRPVTADDQRRVDAMIVRVVALMRDEMSWAKMKPLYLRLYEETFDQDEVDGLLAFYASPTGRAWIEKMPIVLQKTMAMSQQQMQTLMPKVMAIARESADGTEVPQ